MFGLINCNSKSKEAKNDRLDFSGILKGYGDGIIEIAYNDPNEIMKDSIIVKNDKFKFIDTLNSPRFAFLKIMGNENLKKDYYRIDFFLENSKINLNLDINKPENYNITGSKSNDEHRKIIEATQEVNQDYIKAKKGIRTKGVDSIVKLANFEKKKNDLFNITKK
jgi:hypothetical protein